MLGNRGGTVGGNVGDSNPMLSRSVQVNDVDTRCLDADIGQVRQCRHLGGTDEHLVGNQSFGPGGAFDSQCSRGAIINRQLAEPGQSVPGKISRVRRIPVKDNDLHRV